MTGTDPDLVAAVGARVTRDARVLATDVAELVATFGLDGPEAVMLAALPAATALADPPISRYRVGAVGLEAPSGDLLLGGNLEFPGVDLRATVHAEGSIAMRAHARGMSITTLAIDSARPCAYCRQTLVEFAWAHDLRVIDPAGHDRSVDDLVPWPFTPRDLGATGAVPGAVPWPDLRVDDGDVPDDVARALEAAGRRAHAPYSACPSAVVVRFRDGRLVAGMTIENAAFDPSVGPLTVALVLLRAGGDSYADIASAWLATRPDGPVDDVPSSRVLLGAVAPDATLETTTWT
jgi:cytidine deaminase